MDYTPGLPHIYARGLYTAIPEPSRFAAIS